MTAKALGTVLSHGSIFRFLTAALHTCKACEKKKKEMSLADFGIEKRNISQKTSEKNKMRHLKLQRHTQLLLDNILTDYIE